MVDVAPDLLSLQEGVQQRIASDLHDSTCQHLIAASLNIMRLRRAIDNGGNLTVICDDIDASIDQSLKETRAFTFLLYPQNLLADGLKMTIERYVSGFSTRTSLKSTLVVAPEVDGLPYETQRSLLRIIQEALTNVFRHAKATQVGISIEVADGDLRLRVRDDGCGMPVSQARPDRDAFGVGIPGMRTRVRQLGGTLEVESASSSSAEGRGTTLSAVIPRVLGRKRVRAPRGYDGHLAHHSVRWRN